MSEPSLGSLPDNPYGAPTAHFIRELRQLDWRFPYVPQVVQCCAFSVIIGVCCVLYCTVGLASQIASALWVSVVVAHAQMEQGSPLEKSAYAVAVGVCMLLLLPFVVVLLPFWIVGWAWLKLGTNGMYASAVFVVLAVVFYYAYHSEWLQQSLERWSP